MQCIIDRNVDWLGDLTLVPMLSPPVSPHNITEYRYPLCPNTHIPMSYVGFLVTDDFARVDRPLFTAIEHARSVSGPLSSLVLEVFNEVRATDDLMCKRFVWIVLCILYPGITEFAKSTCPIHRVDPWLERMRQRLDTMIDGIPVDEPEEFVIDISAFMAESVSYYLSL